MKKNYNKEVMVQSILDLIDPNNKERSNSYVKNSKYDIEISILFTVQGIILKNKKIITEYYEWLADVFEQVGFKKEVSKALFESFVTVFKPLFSSDEIEFLNSIEFDFTKEKSISPIKYQVEVKQYVNLLLLQERYKAINFINQLSEKMPIEDIFVDILQEALYEIGRLWQTRVITIAQEHYASAVTQFIISNISMNNTGKQKDAKKVITMTIGSELHQLGIMMVSDLMEVNGWDVAFLGGNLPLTELLSYIELFRPQLIALSITLSLYLEDLQNAITTIKKQYPHIKIIVGGKPFINNSELTDQVGADGYALSAIEAVKLGEELLNANN